MDVKLPQNGKEVNDGLVMDFFRLIKKELYRSNWLKRDKEGLGKLALIEEIPQSINQLLHFRVSVV
jgi:hypothetical protein